MADLVLDGVTKRYVAGTDDGGAAVTAADGVDLAVRDGELLVLLGPSGCGKTTLLRLIAGLERPDGGEIAVGGRRVTDLPARKRDVSLVFQDFALFPHLSARENLSFDLRMQGYDDVDRRVREAADLLDVADLLDRSIDELSGGQKQRIALGRAIVTEPSAFLLDEPLANLDANLRERMQTEITRLQRHLGVTTVHVTHDQAEALQMGDRVAVVSEGRVEQVGTPEEIYRTPRTLFVARFVGTPTMNLFRGRLERRNGTAEVVAADGDVAVPVATERGSPDPDFVDGRPVVLGVRPEQVAVAGGDREDDGWISAEVQFDEYRGADRFVYLAVPGGSGETTVNDGSEEAAPGRPKSTTDHGSPEETTVSGGTEVVARVPGTTTFEEGQRVAVSLGRGGLHCFDGASGERLPVGAEGASESRERRDGGDP